ncbi:hypothetical protein [Paenibacillus campinasensis]|nr:hypothetical protein [Paenibacillus campinasensis]
MTTFYDQFESVDEARLQLLVANDIEGHQLEFNFPPKEVSYF